MTKGTFDQLNDALFAQLDKLQSVDAEDADAMERCIEQTKAVSQLAVNIINNANTAISAMRLYDQAGMGAAELVGRAPKMLGAEAAPDAAPGLAPPNWEVLDPFIMANAEGHTVGYLVDRLRSQGADVGYEDIEQRCRELGVEPRHLTGSREEYAEFKRSLAMEGSE